MTDRDLLFRSDDNAHEAYTRVPLPPVPSEYPVREVLMSALCTTQACNYFCVRCHRNGWWEHVLSWLGWYPWRCGRCQNRFYVRRSW